MPWLRDGAVVEQRLIEPLLGNCILLASMFLSNREDL